MIEGLLGALILIAIIGVIVWVIQSVAPLPAPIKTVIWAIFAIICLLILWKAVGGTDLL